MGNESNDYKLGLQDGMQSRSVELTFKMLEIGLDLNLIERITGFSQTQIATIDATLRTKQNAVDKIVAETKQI